jgi:hypothetical protein
MGGLSMKSFVLLAVVSVLLLAAGTALSYFSVLIFPGDHIIRAVLQLLHMLLYFSELSLVS